jgi:hypothetical protein
MDRLFCRQSFPNQLLHILKVQRQLIERLFTKRLYTKQRYLENWKTQISNAPISNFYNIERLIL